MVLLATDNGMMTGRREQIADALLRMSKRQRAVEFQCLGFQVVRRWWPQLVLSPYSHDQGADAQTLTGVDAEDRRRTVACSLTGTLEKVRDDCCSIQRSGQCIDVLVFVTAKEAQNDKKAEWRRRVRAEFGHDLEVVDGAALVGELELPSTDSDWLCREYLGLDLGGEPTEAKLAEAMGSACNTVVEGWLAAQNLEGTPLLSLGFSVADGASRGNRGHFDLEGAIEVLRLQRRAVLVGEGGAGKTVALIRIAKQMMSADTPCYPILTTAAHMAAHSGGVFVQTAQRAPFQAAQIEARHLAELAVAGKLALLVDGWNEVGAIDSLRALELLREAARDAPALVLVISSREPAIPPEDLVAATFRLDHVSREQRRDYVATVTGSDEVWHILESTPSLEQLTRTPLFLRLATDLGAAGDTIPQGSYKLLATFAQRAACRKEAELRNSACAGYQDRFLEALATAMTEREATHLSIDDAESVVASCGMQFVARALLPEVPPAKRVVDALIAHHVLIPADGVRFQHQRFQEFFACEALLRHITELETSTDDLGWQRFTGDRLNRVVWESALLLLMERLASLDDPTLGSRLARRVVECALPLDAVFVARLAAAGGRVLWATCGTALSTALRNLFEGGETSRELAFIAMLETASTDFEDLVLPVARSGEPQVCFRHLCDAKATAIGCLGEDWQSRFSTLPDAQQEALVTMLGRDPTPDAVRFLASLAHADPRSPVCAAAQAELVLLGRQDLVEDAIDWSSPDRWKGNHSHILVEELAEETIRLHVDELRRLLDAVGPSSKRAILFRLAALGDAAIQTHIEEELKKIPPNDTAAVLLAAWAQADPDRSRAFLIDSMLGGRFWDERLAVHLEDISPDQTRGLIAAALEPTLSASELRRRLAVVSAVDPKETARATVQTYHLEASAASDMARGRLQTLVQALRGLPVEAQISAALSRAADLPGLSDIRAFLELVGPQSPCGASLRGLIVPELLERFRRRVLQMDEVLSESHGDTSAMRPRLACALAAAGDPRDLPTLAAWIREDIADLANAAAHGPRRIADWSHWYAGAVARLDTDEAFGLLLDCVAEPSYIGAASRALQSMINGSPQNLAAHRRAVALRAIRESLAECLSASNPGGGQEVCSPGAREAVRVLAELGDDEAVPLILRATSGKLGDWDGVGALGTLATKDHDLPGPACAAVLDPILESIAAKGEASAGQDPWWLGATALQVLLRSDRPELGVERSKKCWTALEHSGQTTRILSALGTSAHPAAHGFLEELVKAGRGTEAWYGRAIRAVAAHPSLSVVPFLLELWVTVCKTPTTARSVQSDFARALAQAVMDVPASWPDLHHAIELARDMLTREMLAVALRELASVEAAVAATRLLGESSKQPTPTAALDLVRSRFYSSEPVAGAAWSILRPRACNELRSLLLHLAESDELRAPTARKVLLELEVERWESGRPQDEPHHPDASFLNRTARPWYAHPFCPENNG